MNLLSFRRTLLQQETAAKALVISPTSSFTFNSNFKSSLAHTILILLVILLVVALISLYFRRFYNITDSVDHVSGLSQDKSEGFAARALPKLCYETKPLEGMKMWSECSICLSEFEEGETVKLIPYCGHVFHPTCIDTWLSSHVSCPLCRSTQLLSAVDEVLAVTETDPSVVI